MAAHRCLALTASSSKVTAPPTQVRSRMRSGKSASALQMSSWRRSERKSTEMRGEHEQCNNCRSIWGAANMCPTGSDEQRSRTNGRDERRMDRDADRHREPAHHSPEEATSDLAYHARAGSAKMLVDSGRHGSDHRRDDYARYVLSRRRPACCRTAGAQQAAAFDLSAACSGFIYSLATAVRLISSGMYRHVLVVGAECLSQHYGLYGSEHLHLVRRRRGCGRARRSAGGTRVSLVRAGRGRRGGELLEDRRAAARACRRSAADGEQQGSTLSIWPATRCSSSRCASWGSAAEEALESRLDKKDVDLLVPHQANIRIIQSALKRLELPEEKCMINLDQYGNVSAASIPIALAEAAEQGRMKEGDCLVLVGFGGGLTWGASVFVW